MRIGIFGSTGQLGSAFKMEGCIPLGGKSEVDVTDFSAVAGIRQRFDLDVAINCAAVHDLTRCNASPVDAIDTNIGGALNVSLEFGKDAIYISTDYVFDGNRYARRPLGIAERPRPKSVYSITKRLGELITLRAGGSVIRVSALYGLHACRGKSGGFNFVTKILYNVNKELSFPADCRRVSPTNAEDCAKAVVQRIKSGGIKGIEHAVPPDSATWVELAKAIVEFTGLDVEICTDGVNNPETTPVADTNLEPTIELPSWRISIRQYLDKLR